MQGSLRAKAVLIAVATAVALLAFQLFYFLPRQEAWILATLSDAARQSLDQLSVSLAQPLREGRTDTAVDLVEATLAGNSDWRGLTLISAAGQQLYPATGSGTPAAPSDIVLTRAIGPSERPLATATLRANVDGVLTQAEGLQRQLIHVQLLVLLAALVGGLLLLETTVLRPLQQLAHAFMRLTRREFDYPLPTRGTREIRDLVAAFDSARTEVEDYQARLVQLRDDADIANRAKTAFMSRISHELRTPLNSIIGLSELTLEQSPVDSHAHRSAVIIHQSGRHLLALIQQLLDLTQDIAGPEHVTLEPVSVSDVLSDCTALISGMALKHNITIHTPSTGSGRNIRVRADAMRLSQCLLNLLSNAVKYNRACGHVTVDARETGEGNVVISVTDEGQGLSAQEQVSVFEPFERLHAPGLDIEGTGIGLSITRHLVELMEGSIGIDSRPGAGCRFWIALPQVNDTDYNDSAARASPGITAAVPEPCTDSSRPADSPPGRPRTRPRVLVAEDNPFNQKVIASQLRSLDIDCSLASDGADALARLSVETFDLVITDLMMPGMDGYELCRRLRAHSDPRIATLPVLALTANALDSARTEALAAGASEFLTKPINKATLQVAISGQIDLQEMR